MLFFGDQPAFITRVPSRGSRQIVTGEEAERLISSPRSALEISLYTFLQILSVRPFEKIPISSAFFDLDDGLIPVTSNPIESIQ